MHAVTEFISIVLDIRTYAGATALSQASQSVNPGSGPIFLYDVQCSSSDLPSLLDCSTASVPGIHNCQHSQDIGVKCQGQLWCTCGHFNMTCRIVHLFISLSPH